MTAYAAAGLALVTIGLYATITRTNLLQIIIGLEIMARGISLVFILGGAQSGTMSAAQSVVITLILIEAVTVAIALSGGCRLPSQQEPVHRGSPAAEGVS